MRKEKERITYAREAQPVNGSHQTIGRRENTRWDMKHRVVDYKATFRSRVVASSTLIDEGWQVARVFTCHFSRVPFSLTGNEPLAVSVLAIVVVVVVLLLVAAVVVASRVIYYRDN